MSEIRSASVLAPHAATSYTLYGWEVSYYTGKVRSYLRFKGIPFVEVAPNIFNYYVTLRRKTRVVAIPVVCTPEGEWWQDSSDIIDRLEARFPAPSILPATSVQRFAAYLFELWGDEFWLPTGPHHTLVPPRRKLRVSRAGRCRQSSPRLAALAAKEGRGQGRSSNV